jgi:general L-amino acid transport system permease protein
MSTERIAPARRPRRAGWSWRSRAVRGVVWQMLLIAVIALVAWYLTRNTLDNMRARGIQSGFDFLLQPSGFGIGESLIAFDSAEPHWKAFLVGLLNTLRAAVAGIVLATLLGVLLGIARLSGNFLLRTLATGYVEFFRNIPVLLQLLVFYLVLTDWLPPAGEALQPLPGVFLSKNGLSFPLPVPDPGHIATLAGLAAGVVIAMLYRAWARADFERSGRPRATLWPMAGLLLIATLCGWAAGGMPAGLDSPVPEDLNLIGGGAVTPEFLAVTLGLGAYTAAFIAEVVRAGIQAVPHGQTEAAGSLGLSRAQALRLVLLPQALRVIIPPMTNQYLNLTKNSSLAVAVGYPDLVSISNTTLNQTGRAVECIVIIMAVYLVLSLATAALMNWYNARVAIQEK